MKYQFEIMIGQNKVTFFDECTNAKDFFAKSARWFELFPDKCGNKECDSVSLSPVFRQAKGYEYCEVVCNTCNHVLKYGTRKDNQDLFPKGWEPPYQGGSNPEGW